MQQAEEDTDKSLLARNLSRGPDDVMLKSLEVLSLRSENSILKEDLNVIKAEVDNLKKLDNSHTILQLMTELVQIKNGLIEEQSRRDALVRLLCDILFAGT